MKLVKKSNSLPSVISHSYSTRQLLKYYFKGNQYNSWVVSPVWWFGCILLASSGQVHMLLNLSPSVYPSHVKACKAPLRCLQQTQTRSTESISPQGRAGSKTIPLNPACFPMISPAALCPSTTLNKDAEIPVTKLPCFMPRCHPVQCWSSLPLSLQKAFDQVQIRQKDLCFACWLPQSTPAVLAPCRLKLTNLTVISVAFPQSNPVTKFQDPAYHGIHCVPPNSPRRK